MGTLARITFNDFMENRSYLTCLNSLNPRIEIWRHFLICYGCVNGSPLESALVPTFI